MGLLEFVRLRLSSGKFIQGKFIFYCISHTNPPSLIRTQFRDFFKNALILEKVLKKKCQKSWIKIPKSPKILEKSRKNLSRPRNIQDFWDFWDVRDFRDVRHFSELSRIFGICGIFGTGKNIFIGVDVKLNFVNDGGIIFAVTCLVFG